MSPFTRVLLLEDQPADAELIELELKKNLPGAELLVVDGQDVFIAAMSSFQPDLILSDYLLPDCNGMDALRLAQSYDSEIPFIIVTGATNEETAVACMRAGAWNYILKNHLVRLGPAIDAAAERCRLRAEHRRDLELLKEREARYSSLFNNNHAVMLIIDPADGRIIDANPAAAAYYGWGRERLLTMTVGELNTLSPEELKREMARAAGELRNHFFFRHRRADGSIRDVEVFSGPIEMEGRKLLYSIVHDVGRRVEAERELKKALAELKEAQSHMVQQEKMASVGMLAAGVAHEINNPVGFISSNLNTLKKYAERLAEYFRLREERTKICPDRSCEKDLVEAAVRLKIEYILHDLPDLIKESLEGTERVRDIVLSLKSFSRVDQPRRDLVDINGCLEDTLRIVWNELKYKATVSKDYGELPEISCYPGQLNQVFMNLLINAGQALAEKGEIGIRTWFAADEIHVAVSDNGCGIAPENIPRLFEPFFTTKEVGKGTGLGLSISYDIVTRQHGGRLEVESRPGRGSTFTVHLPLRGVPEKGAQDE